MRGRAVLMSTGKDDWQTPPDLFAKLNAEFHFLTDIAATEWNRQCASYIGPDHFYEDRRDALVCGWPPGARWLNPPYSRGLQGQFIAMAARYHRDGDGTTVMLLPARTDTKAFHAHIWDEHTHQPREGVEVRFLRGRLKFVGAPSSAPFPSMVVIFRAK